MAGAQRHDEQSELTNCRDRIAQPYSEASLVDTCAILECEPSVTIGQRLDVMARLAAFGIEAIFLPPGMTLAGMKGQPDTEDDE